MKEGSSPLTRGKRQPPRPRPSYRGLIPAHAGKTQSTCISRFAMGAHPRSRGENHTLESGVIHRVGSSPLTRGKLRGRPGHARPCGLIPAHAGKTIHRLCVRNNPRAHPRSRGENGPCSRSVRASRGSSPLTRGKHFLTCAFIAQIGQILESLELCASSGTYSLKHVYATDAPRDRVRSIGLAPPSSRAASSA